MKSTDDVQQDNTQNPAQKLDREETVSPEYQNALLIEYQIAQNQAWKWDAAIWQTTAIFLPASLAGFVVVAQIQGDPSFKTFITFVVGISAILMVIGWYLMIRRWENLKNIVYYRLHEIEQELGLWKNRYLQHIRLIKFFRSQGLPTQSDHDKAALRRLEQKFHDFPSTSLITMIRLFAIVLVAGWLGILIFEIISFIGSKR